MQGGGGILQQGMCDVRVRMPYAVLRAAALDIRHWLALASAYEHIAYLYANDASCITKASVGWFIALSYVNSVSCTCSNMSAVSLGGNCWTVRLC
jgi:hypothetical protein